MVLCKFNTFDNYKMKGDKKCVKWMWQNFYNL